MASFDSAIFVTVVGSCTSTLFVYTLDSPRLKCSMTVLFSSGDPCEELEGQCDMEVRRVTPGPRRFVATCWLCSVVPDMLFK
jgi:hypothetical protein